jgi:DNA polymerase delta subunit 1
VTIANTQHKFVVAKDKETRGILPMILENLLSERKAAKKEMEKATDPLTVSLLNARQLALKVSANSVYGFTGAKHANMKHVAEATTGAGREIIQFTQDKIRDTFPGSSIVYGDTDSCFVRLPSEFRELSQEAIFKYGEEMAQIVTGALAERVHNNFVILEMEKYLKPLILYNEKKRYVGLCYDHPLKKPKVFARGIELVRKDAIAATRLCQKDIFDFLLKEEDGPFQAVRAVKEMITRILDIKPGDNYDLVKMSKSIKKDYKAKSLPHVTVNELVRTRMPGSETLSGDRVEYVVIASLAGQVNQKVDDLKYAIENKLPPDWAFYLEAFEKPIMRVLSIPLQSVNPELHRDLENFFNAARAKANEMVRAHSMSRQDTQWVSGNVCKDGGVQKRLDMEGCFVSAPKAKKAKAKAKVVSADITSFFTRRLSTTE